MIHARELLLTPIFRMVVLEDPTTLRIPATDLEYDLATFFYHYICGPDLHIHRINISWNDRLYISAEIVTVRQPFTVSGMRWVGLAKRDTEPTLGERYWISYCASVMYLFAIG
jgi:hypothetical protein